MEALQTADLRDFLKEILYDLEEVDEYLKNEALAEAWTTLEDIADKVSDMIYEIKKKWREAGGVE